MAAQDGQSVAGEGGNMTYLIARRIDSKTRLVVHKFFISKKRKEAETIAINFALERGWKKVHLLACASITESLITIQGKNPIPAEIIKALKS